MKNPMTTFVMFSLNYPHNFIEQCFTGVMQDHLRRKFDEIWDKHGSRAAMVVFWSQLDEKHRDTLYEWILNNYTGY